MNISAPASVPDLASLASPQAAAPNTGPAIPGFAPPQSLATGAGTFRSFESTLADLLAVDEKPEKKPEETKTVITGVSIPAPPSETLPLQLAMSFQPVVKTDTAESGLAALQLGIMAAASQETNGKKAKTPQDISAEFVFDVPTQPFDAAPRDASQPALAIVEPKAAAIPDLTPDPELPPLAFTEKFTPTSDAQTDTAFPAAHSLPPAPEGRITESAKNPVDDLPQSPSATIAEPERAPEQGQANGNQQHSAKDPSPQLKPNAVPAVREEALIEKSNFEPQAPVTAPVGEAPPAQSAAPAPAAKSADISHMEPEPNRWQANPSSQTPDTHSISMRVTDGGDTHVELKVTEHAGELKVTVRTADPDLSGSLRENLGDLVHKMEQSGFRADTWHPGQPNSLDNNPQTRRAEGESLGGDNQGRQQQQHSGNPQQRKQQDPERARWIEEMETNFTPDSERKAPIWPPTSVH